MFRVGFEKLVNLQIGKGCVTAEIAPLHGAAVAGDHRLQSAALCTLPDLHLCPRLRCSGGACRHGRRARCCRRSAAASSASSAWHIAPSLTSASSVAPSTPPRSCRRRSARRRRSVGPAIVSHAAEDSTGSSPLPSIARRAFGEVCALMPSAGRRVTICGSDHAFFAEFAVKGSGIVGICRKAATPADIGERITKDEAERQARSSGRRQSPWRPQAGR